MNYYIQGNKEKADQIKAAFEKLGYNTTGWKFNVEGVFYYTHEGRIDLACGKFLINLIKTNPDYNELELPKPHYDIANFHAGMPVLVRDGDGLKWTADLFSYIDDADAFVCTGGVPCRQCIPFNDDTKHLLGTTDMCDEMYINW